MRSIRYAKIEDARILGEIHSQSWKVAYKGIVPDEILDNLTVGKRQEYFEDGIAAGLMCIGKCRDEDKSNDYGEIGGIYLLPQFWNKGIGTELISWGINELIYRGYRKISLWVLEENLSARKFYEKIGFEHDDTIKEINIGKKLNEYRYTKII